MGAIERGSGEDGDQLRHLRSLAEELEGLDAERNDEQAALHQVTDELTTAIETLQSDLMRAQHARRASEEKYTAYINDAPIGVVVVDSAGRFIEANSAACRLTGYSEQELLTMSLSDVIAPEAQEIAREHFARVRAEGKAATEVSLRHKGGAKPIAYIDAVKLDDDRFIAFLTDVSDRHRAAEELRRNAELNQILLDALPPIAMLLRPGTREIVACNRVGEQVGAAPGMSCYKTWGQSDSPCPWCLAPKVWATGEAQHRQAEGLGRVWDAHWIPISDDLYLHYAYDITDLKRAERERQQLDAQVQHTQKLESLGVLAGGIAHDFNNILMAILGNTDVALADLPAVSPVRSSVEQIRAAAGRAAELTNQMLAYSGKGHFDAKPIDLNELIEQTGVLIDASISKKAQLTKYLDPDLPAIDADPAQIRQIVMNLITNASEAIGDRVGTITVATSVVDADRTRLGKGYLKDELPEGPYVCLAVTDTGRGMDEEARSRLFEPFFSTKLSGRGLGLASVLGIVRGHRGTIMLESQPGTGTRFEVLFPCSERPAGPPVVVSPAGTGGQIRSGLTILVIDDEEVVRETTAVLLEREGCVVLTAADGLAGVNVFRENADRIDAVLLDRTMPKMGGEQALREIRNIRENVAVILTSGYSEEDSADGSVDDAGTGFIHKPFEIADLLAKLREVLAE